MSLRFPSWPHIKPDYGYDLRGRTQCNGCHGIFLMSEVATIEDDHYCEICGEAKTDEILHRGDEYEM